MNESRKLEIDAPAESRSHSHPAVGVPSGRKRLSSETLGNEPPEEPRQSKKKPSPPLRLRS